MQNPFVQSFRLKTVLKTYSNKYVPKPINESNEIHTRYKTILDSVEIEQQSKVSVYYIPYVENILFKELKPSGRDLLLYIIYNIGSNTDVIKLKLEKVSKEMQISRPTLISAIKQLASISVICKKAQSEYWVNPHFVFKGNRIVFYQTHYPEYIEVVNEK